VENLAEFRVANAFDGALNVAGTVTPVRPPGGDAESVRVDVRFTSFSLKLGALPTLTIPLTWPKAPLVGRWNTLFSRPSLSWSSGVLWVIDLSGGSQM